MKLLSTASLALLLSTLLIACSPADTTKTSQIPTAAATTENVVLRFAVLGDAEPKPEPQFPHLAAAVADVNRLATQTKLDFVVGVGDIAHKGTLVQYDNATAVLQQLTLPFYPIMGNEEHGSTVERFMQYANSWNAGKITLDSPSYVLEFDTVALVFASPDHGRDFNDSGIAWMLNQLKQLQPKPVLLIVHGAQTGVYPENADKGITHPGFADVIAQPNLAAVISGDLHMDMNRVEHSKQIGKVHYLHIPALERTKIPDESQHIAMYRVFSFSNNDVVQVDTYQTGNATPLAQHSYRFSLPRQP
jgi:Icc protein